MASYTKLKSGEWGVRSETQAPEGATIEVKTKAGEVKSETITKQVWTGRDRDGRIVYLYAIAQRARVSNGRRGRRLPLGSGAGATGGPRGYSNYCTDNADCPCYDCSS